jgi:hypothetical protein
VPKTVKDERYKRISNDNQDIPKKYASNFESFVDCDKPTDMYYLLEINFKCK